MLKQGGHALNLIYITQYVVDVTSSDGYTNVTTAYERIQSGDQDKLLICPFEPQTALMQEAPQPKRWQTTAMLVASPLGIISFYNWKENIGMLEKLYLLPSLVLFVTCYLFAL